MLSRDKHQVDNLRMSFTGPSSALALHQIATWDWRWLSFLFGSFLGNWLFQAGMPTKLMKEGREGCDKGWRLWRRIAFIAYYMHRCNRRPIRLLPPRFFWIALIPCSWESIDLDGCGAGTKQEACVLLPICWSQCAWKPECKSRRRLCEAIVIIQNHNTWLLGSSVASFCCVASVSSVCTSTCAARQERNKARRLCADNNTGSSGRVWQDVFREGMEGYKHPHLIA